MGSKEKNYKETCALRAETNMPRTGIEPGSPPTQGETF